MLYFIPDTLSLKILIASIQGEQCESGNKQDDKKWDVKNEKRKEI